MDTSLAYHSPFRQNLARFLLGSAIVYIVFRLIVGPFVLFFAAMRGDAKTIGICRMLGMSLQDRDQERTLLMLAVERNNIPAVNALLSCGANPNDIYEDSGTTVLMVAATEGFPEIAKALLRYGADVHMRDTEGDTVSQYLDDQPEIRKLLFNSPETHGKTSDNYKRK